MLSKPDQKVLKSFILDRKFTSTRKTIDAISSKLHSLTVSHRTVARFLKKWGITSESSRQAALHRRYIEEAPSLLERGQPVRIAPGFQVFGYVEKFDRKFKTKEGEEYREQLFKFKKGPHYYQENGTWCARDYVKDDDDKGLLSKLGYLSLVEHEVDHQEADGVLHPHYIDSNPQHGSVIAVTDTFSGYTLGGVFREGDPLVLIELLEQLRQALGVPIHYFTTNLPWEQIGPQWWYFRDNDISCRLTEQKTFRNELGGFMRILNQVMKNEFKRCGPTMPSADARLHELRLKIEEEFNTRPATNKGTYHAVRAEMLKAPPPSNADYTHLLEIKERLSQPQRVWKTRTGYVCENHNIPHRTRLLYNAFAIWPDKYFQHPEVNRYEYEGLMSITHIPEGKSTSRERKRLAFVAWEIHPIHFRRLDTLQRALEELPIELAIGMYLAPVSSWTEVFARVLRFALAEVPSEALEKWVDDSLPEAATRLLRMTTDEVQIVPEDAGLELSYLQRWLDYQDALGLERGKGDYYWGAIFEEMSRISYWQNEFHQVLFAELGEAKLVELLWDLVGLTELAPQCRLKLVKVPKTGEEPPPFGLSKEERAYCLDVVKDRYPHQDVDSLSDEALWDLADYVLSPEYKDPDVDPA